MYGIMKSMKLATARTEIGVDKGAIVIHFINKSNTEETVMRVVKATVKGQILIPASLRRKYQIERGTPLRIYDRNNHHS